MESELTDLGFLHEEDKLLFKSAQDFQDLKRLGEIQAEAQEYLRVVVVNQKNQRWFILLDSQGFLAATKFPAKALRLCSMESQQQGSCRRWLNRPIWTPPSATQVIPRTLPSLEDLDL